jgi:hypothetical protein
VRVEHGKVRVVVRDRFDILGIKSSERMKFDAFREILDAQAAGAPSRLVALKYPQTAHATAHGIAAEAAMLNEDGAVKVLFIDGVGGWNPATSGLIEASLRSELPPSVDFHRVVGDDAMYSALPNAPGGMLFVMDALQSMTARIFEPGTDLQRIVQFTESATASHRQSTASIV